MKTMVTISISMAILFLMSSVAFALPTAKIGSLANPNRSSIIAIGPVLQKAPPSWIQNETLLTQGGEGTEIHLGTLINAGFSSGIRLDTLEFGPQR